MKILTPPLYVFIADFLSPSYLRKRENEAMGKEPTMGSEIGYYCSPPLRNEK